MLELLARGLTNKFLHAPTQALNQAGDAERAELVAMFEKIYQIPDEQRSLRAPRRAVRAYACRVARRGAPLRLPRSE